MCILCFATIIVLQSVMVTERQMFEYCECALQYNGVCNQVVQAQSVSTPTNT